MQDLHSFVQRHSFDATLFDLDGTLVNTEPHTQAAIKEVLRPAGVPNAWLPTRLTSGQSWAAIAHSLYTKYPHSQTIEYLDVRLTESWAQLAEKQADEISGAAAAIKHAVAHMKVGVVSSSPGYLIDKLLEHIRVDGMIPKEYRVGSEDVLKHKPEPDSYLLGAERLKVSPKKCLVFEDSIAGIRAAKAAGAVCVVVLEACNDPKTCLAIADFSIENYHKLSPAFWRKAAGL